jgi:hypothetical protein|tara:strand:- start:456 stop:1205 length:750 start_codon:yes stop_codon:yes gene_type:complete
MAKKRNLLKSSVNNSTRNIDTKKYYRFREEVNRLINKYYGTEVSKSEIKNYESKYIEYAADGEFDIYALVATDGWSEYFKMCYEDLHRFIVRPRAIINIGELKLYTVASEKLSFDYYEHIVPEYGNDGYIPEVSKKCEISTRLFQIKEKDLAVLEEAIERDSQLDLKDKQGEIKVEKKKKRRQRIPDNKFKQLCKEVEREHCTRASGEISFFKKLSEMSKLPKYDESGRGYKTWKSAKKRYYEVCPPKK